MTTSEMDVLYNTVLYMNSALCTMMDYVGITPRVGEHRVHVGLATCAYSHAPVSPLY